MTCELNATGLGNVIALCASIVAIIGLYFQSRSTAKQLKLQHFIEYTKRYQEIILNFPEGINRQDFVISEVKSQQERDKTMRYMRAYLDLCFEEWALHDKGLIDDDLWSIWRGGMATAFSKPAFQQAWQEIQQDTEYGAEFQKFADQLKLKR